MNIEESFGYQKQQEYFQAHNESLLDITSIFEHLNIWCQF